MEWGLNTLGLGKFQLFAGDGKVNPLEISKNQKFYLARKKICSCE